MKNVKTLLTLLFFLAFGFTYAQKKQSGLIKEYLWNIIDNIPLADTEVYADPNAIQKARFLNALDSLLADNSSSANDTLMLEDYKVTIFTDEVSKKEYYIIEKEEDAANFFGTYVINPNPSRRMAIESYHPRFDSNTGREGAYLLTELNPMFFGIAGTHRCNSSTVSSCDGTSSVCETNTAF